MSPKVSIRRKPRTSPTGRRLNRMQDGARQGATRAAERIGPAAQQARVTASDRIVGMRRWSAPRLDRAARYVESDLGPRMSSVLSSTARRVEPAKPRTHRVRNAAMMMLGAITAIGVAGALATRRANTMPAEAEKEAEKEQVPEQAKAEPTMDGRVTAP